MKSVRMYTHTINRFITHDKFFVIKIETGYYANHEQCFWKKIKVYLR